jgi:tRNA 2-thiouridine synthesizing protein E
MSEAHHLQFNGQLIETDAQGHYLRHSEQWSEALALVLAEKRG